MVDERLSKIIDFYKDNHGIAKFAGITLTANDLDYLIQQAHRAEHNARDLDILDRELARTQKQNMLYRKLLRKLFMDVQEYQICEIEMIEFSKRTFDLSKEILDLGIIDPSELSM